MSDFDFRQPGLGPLSAEAEAGEPARAVSGLITAYGCRLGGSDPHAPLARAVARSVTEAGLTVHHCARMTRSVGCGVCLLSVQAGPDADRAGVVVPWVTHNLLSLDWDRCGTYAGIRRAMNPAVGGILSAFGYEAEPFGSEGAWLVTGHRHQEAGTGR